MNFDIKYTKYLQIFNFIKIKQVLGTILGAQSWGSKAKATYNSGCKLGVSNRQADMWGPQIRERWRNFAGNQKREEAWAWSMNFKQCRVPLTY